MRARAVLMDPRPVPHLPHYNLDGRCHDCGRPEVHRVEIWDRARGLMLICGTCAHAIGLLRDRPRDPFA
jgi:hypothetical protein